MLDYSQRLDLIQHMTHEELQAFAVTLSLSDINGDWKQKFESAIDSRFTKLSRIHPFNAEHAEISAGEFESSF